VLLHVRMRGLRGGESGGERGGEDHGVKHHASGGGGMVRH
jgi:hypothetical protein